MFQIGIALGLTAALLQSFSYVFSRRFNVQGHGGAANLLVISHVILGGVSLPAIFLLWHDKARDFSAYALPLLGASGYYLIGQLFMFAALRKTDASRISPLLGLKIVMVALLWILFSKQGLTAPQWGAVVLASAAAFVLNRSGGVLPASSLGMVLMTCFFYALSDLDIIRLIRLFEESGMSRAHASALAAAQSYLLCALLVLPLLPWYGSRKASAWRAALPFSAFWLLGMALFYPTLAMVGAVLGNIALATRGLFSIALGMAISALGHEHLEKKTPLPVVLRRGVAALMMIGAIALYVLGAPRPAPADPAPAGESDVPISAPQGK